MRLVPSRSARLLLVLAFLLGAFPLACGDSEPAPTPTPATTQTPLPPTAASTLAPASTPEPPRGARSFSPELRTQIQPLLDRTAQLHGSPPKGEVAMNLVGRPEAIEYLRSSFSEEDLRLIQVQEEVYHLLSLIPESVDLLDTFLSFLGGGILGFYDPELKAFYLLDDIGGVDSFISRTTLVHEFTHALQDQYYDIKAIGDSRERDWDAAMAFADVIEGDAVATESAFLGFSARRASCFTIPAVNSGGVPYVIQRDLNTWYEDGLCFVREVAARLERGSTAIFENLPTTTEQILHPEKFLAGEEARPVTLTPLEAALGEGWKEIDRSTLGEFTLQNLLVLGLPGDRLRVQAAAAGWGGGGWLFYGRDGARLIEAMVVWDTPEDAQAFWLTLADSVRARATSFAGAEGAFRAELDGKAWRAAVSGDRVTFVVATDAAGLARAAAALGLP